MEAVCLQEKLFYFVSVRVPHCSDAPNDRFLSNAFNRCLKLSGVLLKLCRSMFGCVKKILSDRLFLGNLNVLVHFPKTLHVGLIAYPQMIADLFLVPKTTFLTIQKQQTLNFSYHESSR